MCESAKLYDIFFLVAPALAFHQCLAWFFSGILCSYFYVQLVQVMYVLCIFYMEWYWCCLVIISH